MAWRALSRASHFVTIRDRVAMSLRLGVVQVKEEPGIKQEDAVKEEPCSAGLGVTDMLLRMAAYTGPYPGWPAPTAGACRQVAERLAAVHGWPSLQRKANPGQPQPVLDALVRTLLSQNTTDLTSARAFATLKQRFPKWEAVRVAPLTDVADAIRVGGLAEIKAGRIQAILSTLAQERGQCSLEHLRALPTPEVKAELSRFRGVGRKTAACVLLFALERQDFAVDTHVWEITKALGWIPVNASRDQAYDHLNERVPEDLRYDLHVLLVRHGKACPACAKAGSARAAKAAAAGVDCPLVELKLRKSELKSVKPGSPAATAGANIKGKGKQQQQKGSKVGSKVEAAGEAAAAAGGTAGGTGAGRKRRKVAAE